MNRSPAVLFLVSLLTTSLAYAKPGIVKIRNGQTYQGDVEENADSYTVTSKSGIKTQIPRADIASVTYTEPFDQELAARRAKLSKTDVKGRIALANEAFSHHRYLAARDLAQEALNIDPNSTDANAMLTNAMAQLRLERVRTAPATTHAAVTAAAPTTAPLTAPSHAAKVLSPAQINTIRQFELQSTETDVPIHFENDVRRKYALGIWHHPIEQFMRMTPMQQAVQILHDGTPAMQNDVKIMRDPAAMMIYRRTIQPYVIQNCATSRCHGGSNGDGLILLTPAESEPATYTNFFILQSYTKSVPSGGGIFGHGDLHLIDRTQPSKSLLLQYSIPQDVSDYDHPVVQGYRPPLRGLDDPRYQQIWSWIHDALNPSLSLPNYGISYTPPTASAATKPATTQAPEAPAP
jgi:hypothetical protein